MACVSARMESKRRPWSCVRLPARCGGLERSTGSSRSFISIEGSSFLRCQGRRGAAIFGMTTLAFAVFFSLSVEATSCRGYPQGVRAAIKKQVEALRALERETADRLKGLDTRPFDYLLSRARATAQVIAAKDALAAEEGLSRCREATPPGAAR